MLGMVTLSALSLSAPVVTDLQCHYTPVMVPFRCRGPIP